MDSVKNATRQKQQSQAGKLRRCLKKDMHLERTRRRALEMRNAKSEVIFAGYWV